MSETSGRAPVALLAGGRFHSRRTVGAMPPPVMPDQVGAVGPEAPYPPALCAAITLRNSRAEQHNRRARGTWAEATGSR